jgi:hypothetical protein
VKKPTPTPTPDVRAAQIVTHKQAERATRVEFLSVSGPDADPEMLKALAMTGSIRTPKARGVLEPIFGRKGTANE